MVPLVSVISKAVISQQSLNAGRHIFRMNNLIRIRKMIEAIILQKRSDLLPLPWRNPIQEDFGIPGVRPGERSSYMRVSIDFASAHSQILKFPNSFI